ncbi:PadR family transcriptional regulator [Pantoea sp. B65]|uniref:PadR family transcriptional regulator n=1 Tax=Pantoea sp. B65 TaxID=2813359 RepID=UPI0039B4B3F4
MFNRMFKEHRGGHRHPQSPSDDRQPGGFDHGDNQQQMVEMMFAEWHQAMRARHGHRHHADQRGDRHDGHRGHRRDGDDFGHRDRPSFLRGRKFGADELQLLLLNLLKEQASYGYELIKILTDKSGGFYTPSPGVIYPALTWMEDVGYVTVQQEGNRKRYAINQQGESYLAENQSLADALFAKLALFSRQSDSVNQAMREQRHEFEPELMAALHTLRNQLHQYHHSSEDIQRQVAAILQQTLAQLQAVKP